MSFLKIILVLFLCIGLVMPFIVFYKVKERQSIVAFKRHIWTFLKFLSTRRQELIFLASALTFYISVLSIVFGVSSNIIDEYLRTDGVDSYEFRKLTDILKFPVEQSLLLNATSNSIVPSYAKFDPKIKTLGDVKEFRVLDASVEHFDEALVKQVKAELKKNGSSIPTSLTKSRFSFVLLELLHRHLFEGVKNPHPYQLHYMLPLCKRSDHSAVVTKQSSINTLELDGSCLEELNKELSDENIWPVDCIPRDTESRFDLLFQTINNWILKDAPERTQFVITIMSDFNAENDDVLDKTLKSVKAFELSNQNRDIRFNLLRVRAKESKSTKDHSQKVTDQILKEFPNSHVLDLRKPKTKPLISSQLLYPYARSEQYTDKLSMASRMIRDEDTNVIQFEGRLKKPLDSGDWGFRITDADKSKGLEITIGQNRIELKDTEPHFIKVEEGQSLIITYQGDDYYEFAGDLEVFNATQLSRKRYNLWQRRVLNQTTIGFITIGIVSILFIISLSCYVFIREIRLSKLLFNTISKNRFINDRSMTMIYLSLLLVIICLLSPTFWVFLQHAFSVEQLQYPQPYFGVLIVFIIFLAIRFFDNDQPPQNLLGQKAST